MKYDGDLATLMNSRDSVGMFIGIPLRVGLLESVEEVTGVKFAHIKLIDDQVSTRILCDLTLKKLGKLPVANSLLQRHNHTVRALLENKIDVIAIENFHYALRGKPGIVYSWITSIRSATDYSMKFLLIGNTAKISSSLDKQHALGPLFFPANANRLVYGIKALHQALQKPVL